MFFGYDSEAQAREVLGDDMIDKIMKTPCTTKTMTVCTKSGCSGSLPSDNDGQVFFYTDGTTDSGKKTTKKLYSFQGHEFCWYED